MPPFRPFKQSDDVISLFRKGIIIAALVFLSFVLGGAALYFQWGPGPWLEDAFTGGAAWEKKERVIHPPQKKKQHAAFSLKKNGKVVIHRPGMQPGYTLVTVKGASAAWLIDEHGAIVHRWALPFSAIWTKPPHIKKPLPDHRVSWHHAVVYPNGDLVVLLNAAGDTPYGYGVIKVDRDSKLLWKYAAHAHHDLDIGPDGSIYFLTDDFSKQPIRGISLRPPFLLDWIAKLTTNGKEEKKISLIEAFQNSPYMNLLTDRDPNAQRGDLLHTNAVWVLREGVKYRLAGIKPGQLLFSVREYNIIGVIDPEQQKIVWATKGPWRGQHDPRFLENGNILLFDNLGAAKIRKREILHKRSRVIEYDPAAQNMVWSYSGTRTEPFYARYRGSVEVLPNGNILISAVGRILEIKRNQEIVWEYRVHGPKGTVVTTAQRYVAAQVPFLREKIHAP